MRGITAAILAISFATGSAHATDFSFTGNFSNDDEVQPFNFSVVGPATYVTFRTWSSAGDTNAAGTEIASGGFQPLITLFGAADRSIEYVYNLDNGDPSFISGFAPGNYIVTLTQFDNVSKGNLADGFGGTNHRNFDGRDSHWAFDVLNVSSASAGVPYISHVPEPESYAMFMVGLGLLGFMARRKTT